ncbi:MAG: response regulator, partial [Flammeovirgaceae bacterium]
MSYRILTIEDDLILAEDLKLKLDQLGYRHVGNATNFTEAIDLVNENQPDLIVSDIRLGNSKDGIDIIQEIYQSYKCPVIYLTANSEPVTVKRALATSPAAFLLKPYRFEEFTIQIDLAIQRFKEELTFEKANPILSDSILLPFEYLYYRVRKSDIFYVEADGAYV